MSYETETTLTKDEATKLAKAHLLKASREIWIYVLIADILFLISGILYLISGKVFLPVVFFAVMVILPVLVIVLTISRSRKEWQSNKLIQNAVYRFRFHDGNFEVETPNGKAEVGYEKLYRIIETKDRFYLYISKNQTYPVNKEKCESGLISFLHEKC